MSPLAHSLLALAALLAATDAGRDQLLFGVNTPHFVRLNEVILNKHGGMIKVTNYCSGTPKGQMVGVANGLTDRIPYVEGPMLSLRVSCTRLGPHATCNDPISVNVTQFC